MNFKLKKALKEVYSAEKPDNAKSFAKELARNSSFRKLHPVSSFLNAYPAIRTAATAIAVSMAVGGGFLAMHFILDKDDKVQNNSTSSILSEDTETTVSAESDEIIYTTETISAVTHLTESTATESTTVSAYVTVSSVSATEKVRVTTTPRSNAVPVGDSYIPSAVPNTAAPPERPQSPVTMTTSVMEIYNTHIWKHDYSFDAEKLGESSKEEIREWRKNLYGYAQNDLKTSLELMCLVENIIYGTIQDIDYTVIDGKPWTIVNLKIDRSYHFESNEELWEGDVITIYEPGGYMPLADYITDNPSDSSFAGWSSERIANTVIYEDGSNYVKPEIGESYLYFVSKVREYDKESTPLPADFPTGVYIRKPINDSAQFSFDGERFICSNPNQSISFTEDELIQNLPSRWNYYTSPDGKNTLAVRQYSSIFYGDVTFYITDENGFMEHLYFDLTDDGFYPFDDNYTLREDENGNCIMEGENFTITWTDLKIIISYMTDYLLDERRVIEIDYNV